MQCVWASLRRSYSGSSSPASVSASDAGLVVDSKALLSDSDDEVVDGRTKDSGFWYSLGGFLNRRLWVALVAVLLMSPLSYCATQLRHAVDQNQLHPHTWPA